MADEQIKVVYDVGVSDVKQAESAVKNLKSATDQAADSTKKLETASKDAAKANADAGRAAMNAGQALQDYVQGGFGGILNNLPRLAEDAAKHIPVIGRIAEAFGGPLGLAAAVTTTGVAAYVAAPLVKGMYEAITTGSATIPEASDLVGKLSDRLAETRDRLKEVTEGWKGTAANLAEHNKLTAEAADLEKKLGEAKKDAAALDAQRAKEKAPDAESQKAVSEAVKAAGGVDKVTADVLAARPGASTAAQGQLDQVMREQDAAMKAAGSNPSALASVRKRFAQQIADAQATLAKTIQEAQAGASDLVTKALQGDQGAVRELGRSLPGRGFDRATSEAIARDKENLAAGEEQAKRDKEEADRREKANAERRKAREKDEAEQAAAEKFYDKQELDRKDRIARMQIAQDEAGRAGGGGGSGSGRRGGGGGYGGGGFSPGPGMPSDPNDPFAGINTPLDLALAFDGQGNPTYDPTADAEAMADESRRAGIRRRSALRKPIGQVAGSFGIDLTKQQLEQAASMVDWGQGQGMQQGDAIAAALQEIVNNQMAMADQQNQGYGQLQKIRQQAARVPSLLEWGSGW